jgi:hypothetical protein
MRNSNLIDSSCNSPPDSSHEHHPKSRADQIMLIVESWLDAHGFVLGLPDELEKLDSEGPWPYGHHSAYYRASMRGNFISGTKDGVLIIGGLAPTSISLQTPNPVFVILRPYGKNVASIIKHEMVRMSRSLKLTLIIKAVDTDLASTLIDDSASIRSYNWGEYWHPAAPLDDQTFSEVVLDRPLVLQPHHNICSNLFREPLQRGQLYLLREINRKWLRWYVKRHCQWGGDNLDAFYSAWLKRLETAEFDICLLYRRFGSPAAFVLGDFVNSKQVDLWVALATQQYNGFTRDFFSDTIQYCWNLGAQFINLGGSELHGLHWFKTTSFGTSKLIQMTHIVVDGTLGKSAFR